MRHISWRQANEKYVMMAAAVSFATFTSKAWNAAAGTPSGCCSTGTWWRWYAATRCRRWNCSSVHSFCRRRRCCEPALKRRVRKERVIYVVMKTFFKKRLKPQAKFRDFQIVLFWWFLIHMWYFCIYLHCKHAWERKRNWKRLKTYFQHRRSLAAIYVYKKDKQNVRQRRRWRRESDIKATFSHIKTQPYNVANENNIRQSISY